MMKIFKYDAFQHIQLWWKTTKLWRIKMAVSKCPCLTFSAAMSCLDGKISVVLKHQLMVPATLFAPATQIPTDKATKIHTLTPLTYELFFSKLLNNCPINDPTWSICMRDQDFSGHSQGCRGAALWNWHTLHDLTLSSMSASSPGHHRLLRAIFFVWPFLGGRWAGPLRAVSHPGLVSPHGSPTRYNQQVAPSGANLTSYSGVIFYGVILTPKRSWKNYFSGGKVTPDIEELK